ncbi:MAG: hypothetical protein JWM80_5907 [Cyanobacteria bacterium RYN_339]|nr:hypothetical protein [Cyanobacteria bacterium RYN_339]
MRIRKQVWAHGLLALWLAAAGCAPKFAPPTSAKPSRAPGETTVTNGIGGLGANGGVISNNGSSLSGALTAPASIIGSGGGNIIGSGGGNIIGSGGGNIIGSGGSLRRVLAVFKEAPLAGVTVELRNAAGAVLKDKSGKPFRTTADAKGNYSFKQALPAGTYVLAAILPGNRGEVRAVVPAGRTRVDGGFVSTLTTTYILDRFVSSQADPAKTLAKLPADVEAATRAKAEDALATGTVPTPDELSPRYVVAAVDALRGTSPSFNDQMETVKRLLTVGSISAAVTDGAALSAQLSGPHSFVFGKDGTLYFSEIGNRLVRKLTPDGKIITVAGNGEDRHVDGKGLAAGFTSIGNVGIDLAGNLYVAENYGHYIRKITPDGAVTSWVGTGEDGFADGPGAQAKLGNISDLVTDAAGTVWVLDFENSRLRKVSPDGVVSTVAGDGQFERRDGQGTAASFQMADTIRTNGKLLYVKDNNGIRTVTPEGLVTTVLPTTPDGPGALLGADPAGNIYVGRFSQESFSQELWRVTPDGTAVAVKDDKGKALPAGDVAFAPDGDMILGQPDAIWKVSPAGKVTVLAGGQAQLTNSDASKARFLHPGYVAGDKAGNIYVADIGNNVIRKVAPDGQVSTFAGSGESATKDGQGTAAAFSSVSQLRVDAAGNLYVASERVRKITPDGLVTTLPVTPQFGFDRDAAGNTYTMSGSRLLKITSAGVESALAGMEFSTTESPPPFPTDTGGDGVGPAARFDYVEDLTVGPDGVLYLLDRLMLRKVTADGKVTTLFKTVPPSAVADQDRPETPQSLAIDAKGNFYIYMYDRDGASYITKISPTGTIGRVTLDVTLPGYDGLAGHGLGFNAQGDLIIVDTSNNVLRVVPAAKL